MRGDDLNKELKKYYKHIKKNISYSSRQSSKLLKDLNYSIEEYCDKNPTLKIQDIITEFGTPDEIAAYFMSNVEPDELGRKLSLKRFLTIGFTTALLIFAFIYITAYVRGKDIATTKSYDIIEIETVQPTE